jgi:Site-specific recombinase XerD
MAASVIIMPSDSTSQQGHQHGRDPLLVTRFATHCHSPVAGRLDIRTVQELLGHKDVKTTMIHTHVLNRRGQGCGVRVQRTRWGPRMRMLRIPTVIDPSWINLAYSVRRGHHRLAINVRRQKGAK